MALVKLPKFFQTLASDANTADLGTYAPKLINGYLAPNGAIRRFPGLKEYLDLETGKPIRGAYWNDQKRKLYVASGGRLYVVTNGTAIDVTPFNSNIFVSGWDELQEANHVAMAYMNDPNYGGILFVADGNNIGLVTDDFSFCYKKQSDNNTYVFRCKKTHLTSADNAPPDPLIDNTYENDYWAIGFTTWVAGSGYFVSDLMGISNRHFVCIKYHEAALSNKPGVGPEWTQYWREVSPTEWEEGQYRTAGMMERLENLGSGENAPSRVTDLTVFDGYLCALEADSARVWFNQSPFDWQTWVGDYISADFSHDNLVAIDSGWNQLITVGTTSFERWENDGVSPFTVNKPATVPSGASAVYSLIKFDNAWWYLNELRQFVKIQGVVPQVMSLPIGADLANMQGVESAIGSACVFDSTPWIMVNFSESGRTFLFNLVNQTWSEVGEFNEDSGDYEPWRVSEFLFAQALGKVLCLADDGKIYTLDTNTHEYGSDRIRLERRTGEIDHDVPAWKRSFSLTLRIERMSRADDNDDMAVLVSWRDNGSTQWSNDREMTLTKIGDTTYIAKINRLGRYRTRQYRFVIDSPTVDYQIVDAVEDVAPGRI